jgi:hypothetical protein
MIYKAIQLSAMRIVEQIMPEHSDFIQETCELLPYLKVVILECKPDNWHESLKQVSKSAITKELWCIRLLTAFNNANIAFV